MNVVSQERTEAAGAEKSAARPARVVFARNFRGINTVTGGESYLFSLARGLARQGCEILLVAIARTGQEDQPWARAVRERDIPCETVLVDRRESLRDLFVLPGIMRRFDADVVHSIDHRGDFVGLAAARTSGRAAVASFFGWTNFEATSTKGRLYSWVDRQVLGRADAVIVDSAYMGRQLATPRHDLPVTVLHNGVDVARFDPGSVRPTFRSRWFGDGPVTVLGMIGRIHPNKGQLDFVQAAAALRDRMPDARFVIVGDAPPGFEDYKKKVIDAVAENGLGDRVLVTNATNAEIPEVVASLDVLAAPSYVESCSYSILEGMAMGKPVLASDAGGNPEIVGHDNTGLVVPVGDQGRLAEAAEALIADSDRRERLGGAARKWIESEGTLDVMARRTLDVYHRASKRPH